MLAQAVQQAGGADPQTLVVWGVALLAAAVLLGFTEVFVPSGGVIGILAVIAGAAGVVVLFIADPMLGLAGSAAMVVLTPVVIGLGLKVWPYTPVGRRMLLSEHQEAVTPVSAVGVAVGERGFALSALRPMGSCRFEGRVVECTAEEELIDEESAVVVTKVDGQRVLVRVVGEK